MDKATLTPDTPVGSLIPYYFQNLEDADGKKVVGEFWCYNDITKRGDLKTIVAQSADYDPFAINKDTQKQYYIPLGYDPLYKIH